jgi:hypothetical protein
VPEFRCLVSPPPQLLSSTFQLVEVATRLEHEDVPGARKALYSIDLAACERYWSECGHEAAARHDPVSHSARGEKRKRYDLNLWIGHLLGGATYLPR